jgi:hypothetical protein
MPDRLWTDTDRDRLADVLWARQWAHPGVSLTVAEVITEHGPPPQRYYADAAAVLDALTADGSPLLARIRRQLGEQIAQAIEAQKLNLALDCLCGHRYADIARQHKHRRTP